MVMNCWKMGLRALKENDLEAKSSSEPNDVVQDSPTLFYGEVEINVEE